MFLKNFKVQLYRSCQKTNVPLNQNLTGLIGTNGSGKTNILNALLLLRKICEGRYRYSNILNREASLNNICRIEATIENNGKEIQMKGKISLETDDKNNDEIIDSELKWKFSNYKTEEWHEIPLDFFPIKNDESPFNFTNSLARLRLARQSKQNIFKIIKLFEDKNFKKEVAPQLNEVFNFFNGINYYGATQFSDPNKCPVSIELEDNRPRRRGHSSSNHEQFIFDLFNSKEENAKEYKRYVNAVNQNGVGLIDSFDFKTLDIPSSIAKVRSGGKINVINNQRKLIVPIFKIDGLELSPNQLSEGTFKTLALLYYILTDKSSLLLIEEPEVCIHHGLLDSIIKLIIMQSKQKQIIISTHSDFVLDHLSPENVLLTKYSSKEKTSVSTLKNRMGNEDFKALKKYLKESGNLGEYWREGGLSYD